MKIFRRTLAIIMSAVILAGTGAVAASAAGNSEIVETSTTIKNADDAYSSKFSFNKQTGELRLEEYCDNDFYYDDDYELGESIP